MPKREDIQTILVIGSGPIVIGQACEFDYSGAQACKVLKADGYRVVLVNSNPATIMTDPGLADRTYVEPITVEFVEQVIAKERPDALLPTLGGQTGLNTAVELARAGILAKYGVEMIGCDLEAIERGEDRKQFNECMAELGIETSRSGYAYSIADAEDIVAELGYPVVLRPSFTLGGAGGGIAHDAAELHEIVGQGLELSPAGEVLVEESIEGWKEYEMEVMRDRAGNGIIVCSIENFDAMGVHTGDSITVAPAQTLSDVEYQRMRAASLAILEKIGVETGGSNVQFAVNPENRPHDRHQRSNPRVSRSSALASEGHGLPHREGGREAGRGLHARRDRERHHEGHARLLRAVHRLLRGEGAALRVREVPGHRRHAVHAHEGRRRGHGHRPNVRGIARQGHAFAGERARGPGSRRQRRRGRRVRRGAGRPRGASHSRAHLLPGRGAASRLDG